MSSSLFPRRDLKTSTKRKARRRITIDKNKILIAAIAIAIVASFLAGVEVSNKLFAKTVTHTMTFVNVVTKTYVKSVVKTITITSTLVKTYVPSYVNPQFKISSIELTFRASIPMIALKYLSSGPVLLKVTLGNATLTYPLPQTKSYSTIALPIAGPCMPISNKSLRIVISSFLGKVLYNKSIEIGAPRIVASMIQYFLDPSNPHIVQRLQLQLTNYGVGPAEVGKITIVIKDKHGAVVARRDITVSCIYVEPKQSAKFITPQLYIYLPSGEYLVYAHIENSLRATLYEGEIGSIVIG